MRSHYVSDAARLSDGTEVTLGGWLHEVRDIKKIVFAVLRDRSGSIQITAKRGEVPDNVVDALIQPKETVVLVTGKVVHGKGAKAGVEIIPSRVEVVGKVYGKVPFDIADKDKIPELDVRLDNRHVDLRRPAVQAIFRVRATVQQAFREYLLSQGFDEIVPTSIVGAATEGGAELFPIVYFDREAFLAQSPQLYKQMAVIGGMDKVFMQCLVYRAEPHSTTTHLNEVYQMDIEMGFADDNTVMDVEEEVLKHILRSVLEKRKEELSLLGAGVSVPQKIPRFTYTQLVDKLRANGEKIEWGDDFSRAHEKMIGELVGSEAYFITKWPTRLRAFYSMPSKDNVEVCNAFDLIYRGLEISSGAQRIHDPDLLVQQIRGRGLNPDNFEFYIRAFRAGAPPHAGWSIGAERLTMKICSLDNIREATLFPRDMSRIFP
ncbi:MAG: aspartate--tRNA(Asn) ligase [Candidatus Micrarchaeota archaeon]|nr:aspartate--tRNA(Asn) ligase [Candidatus Micrarchaeota archaeon]